MSTIVPAALPAWYASRHLDPYTPMVPFTFSVNSWLLPALQVQMSNCVPFVVLELGTSRHLPDWLPTSSCALVPALPGTPLLLRTYVVTLWAGRLALMVPPEMLGALTLARFSLALV